MTYTPAWVILGNLVIKDYQEGKRSQKSAYNELMNLGVHESMLNRLNEKCSRCEERHPDLSAQELCPTCHDDMNG